MNCYHCGDPCTNNIVHFNTHVFCCNGCKSVFEILNENGLGKFYEIGDKGPGVKRREEAEKVYFDFLELEEYQNKYVLFQDDQLKKIQLYLPQIHCNSCIWLLENLKNLNSKIHGSEVNFSRKTIQVTVDKSYALKSLALFLDSLGYPPDFSTRRAQKNKENKILIYKIGIAGFCFGNIMLLSFPEYLGLSDQDITFRKIFLYLSFFLTLPVVFYAGFDYLKYAFYGLKNKVFNMELPIALGIITLFLRSTYELIDFQSQAYFDSLSGLIFFLLIGKWYQEKTFSNLRFRTDQKSYFPMAVQVLKDGAVQIKKTENLNPGDELLIRNYELIPADAELRSTVAKIDYSFVTGESQLVQVDKGDSVWAGGRLVGEQVKFEVIKKANESYLTGLWNSSAKESQNAQNQLVKISNYISRYFTIFLLLLSLATALYWFFVNPDLIWKSVISVLIVACPCALALSIPFTYGNALRAFGKSGLFFRKSEVIDQLTQVDTIVFDKTGTLTTDSGSQIIEQSNFKEEELKVIVSGCANSMHPLSQIIYKELSIKENIAIESFKEFEGSGISFKSNQDFYKIGSAEFVGTTTTFDFEIGTSNVFVQKNENSIGFFKIKHAFRQNLEKLINDLSKDYQIHIVSGDNNLSEDFIKNKLNIHSMHFNQKPAEKAAFVKSLQEKGHKVLMLGDGINDTLALAESYFGIAVSNTNQGFKPTCDAILEGESLVHLASFLRFSNYCKKVVIISFILSFLYNIIGLQIAVQGLLSPVYAALLMPLSSVSVVLFGTLTIRYYSNRMMKKNAK